MLCNDGLQDAKKSVVLRERIGCWGKLGGSSNRKLGYWGLVGEKSKDPVIGRSVFWEDVLVDTSE